MSDDVDNEGGAVALEGSGQAGLPESGEAAEQTREFAEDLHPRAAAGTATGGQFVAGSAASGASGSKKQPAKQQEMGYDAKAGKGTGYDKKGGDAKVKALQQALNALGLTDASGKKLVIDGKLGPKTTQAIKAAQRKLGMKATGKVGADFVSKLKAAKNGPSITVKKTTGKIPAKKTAQGKPGMVKGAKEADMEERDQIVGRVVEALDDDESGGRVFRVRIIAYGDSRNRRRYPEAVLSSAARLYEGSKAYDHHRSDAELQTSTINGLVGYYRDVQAEADGLYGDLHLFPGAKHAAEALDATLAAQESGLDPLIGVSHDVYATYKPVVESGRRLQEATAITKVNSADLVADPAAGGKAVRMVAGGIEEDEPGTEPDELEEDDVPPSKEDILGALADATEEELAAVGLARPAPAESVAETPVEETATEAVREDRTVEAGQPKDSFLGKLLIKTKVEDAGLPAKVAESLAEALPDRITESDVDAQIAALKTALGVAERAGLAPTAPTISVLKESVDKKRAALDAFFAGNWSEGYRSFRQAWQDFTGARLPSWDEDINRLIMRESIGGLYDSGDRSRESLDSTSWAQVLGDSITRRLVAMYRVPSLQSWRQIVSSVVPVNDFRTQRVGRVGGYGVLPTVNEGAPYAALTSPPDEEATYAISKRGGTEDLTMEMIANDDVRAIAGIPNKLGRAAAQTLYRFVWDFIRTNATCTYDSTALFHSNHANTGTTALSETTLSAARQAMREQTAYGDSSELLDLTPRLLIVPPALETVAWKLTTSAVSVGAASTDAEQARTAPNLHSSLDMVVVPYFTADDNNWYVIADPDAVPTIEVGFYRGQQEPELFSQTDPNQGAVFNADKITWKVRHIYSGTILDHRGMYGGIVA